MASADLFGHIYFDPEFQFKDGDTGAKRFVVLCASPEFDSKVVVVRTTSQDKGARSYGCNLNDRYQNFYLPAESGAFPKPTWIMLDYALEYPISRLGSDRAILKNKLGPIAFKDLLECASKAQDIERDIKAEALRLVSRMCRPT